MLQKDPNNRPPIAKIYYDLAFITDELQMFENM